MPRTSEVSFIVFARDDLSGWVEPQAIPEASSFYVSKFLYEEVVCRHGCPRRIILDGGRENLDLTKDLLQHYRIKGTTISAFHPQANGLVERGHGPIVNSIAKYCDQPIGRNTYCSRYVQIGSLFVVPQVTLHLSYCMEENVYCQLN